MQASVAIVQLRQSGLSDRSICSPQDYDVIVLDEPSTSYNVPKYQDNPVYTVTKRTTVGNHAVRNTVITLPTFRVTDSSMPLSESVLMNLMTKTRFEFRRVVPVPLWDDRPSSSTGKRDSLPIVGTALLCAPCLTHDKISYPYGRLENLSRLVNMCMNTPEMLDVQTRHMILRIESWLEQSQRMNAHFLATLFIRKPARTRVLRCVHNPTYVGQEIEGCIRHLSGSKRSIASSGDLDERVRSGNLARVEMIQYEKYNTFVMNPLFDTGLVYSLDQPLPAYFAVGSRTVRANSATSQKSDDWSLKYPMHRAAYLGDAKTIESLIALGMSTNEADPDSWTALHYACFYGRLDATRALLNGADTKVNAQSKSGETALHFSARSGNAYLTELILSHPAVDMNLKNREGQRAMDLCENVPKKQWQEVAMLLRNWKKLEKIQVDFIDGGNVMVALPNGADTLVEELHTIIGQEVKLSNSAMKIFSIWVCSDSMNLQLKPDFRVLPQLSVRKWKLNLMKFAETEAPEKPRLVFRRNAQATLDMERNAAFSDFGNTLLYEEARQNYLKGYYPCETKNTVFLAAICARILYGNNQKISEQADLAAIMPANLLAKEKAKDLRSKLSKALKEVKSTNISHLQMEFLNTCRELKTYGSTFFNVDLYVRKPFQSQQHAICGVNDYGLHLINSDRTLFSSYQLKELIYVLNTEKMYLELTSRARGHQLTMVTPQAGMINVLLNKLNNLDTKVISSGSSIC